jgi:hypothetical protein
MHVIHIENIADTKKIFHLLSEIDDFLQRNTGRIGFHADPIGNQQVIPDDKGDMLNDIMTGEQGLQALIAGLQAPDVILQAKRQG